MPRVGLNTADVVLACAELADENGIASVSLSALADRLGVKAPALYNHVDGIADLRRRVATLAMTELGDSLREGLQGKSGIDAIRALFLTVQAYIAEHPGRYGATTGAEFRGDDDPLFLAGKRIIDSFRAVLSAYPIAADEVDHAIRFLRCTFDGYAMLQANNAFQWANDPDQTVEWIISFVDSGLAASRTTTAR